MSAAAAKLSLNRLARQGLIAAPVRGFHIIIPPEYRSLGSLPAEQFVPALMDRQGQTYYAGLLSAAQFHGVAHHRPQEFQVVVMRPHRPIVCGQVRVTFVVRKNVGAVPVQSFNTPRGTIRVSTPEATAFDLVGYADQAGGLDQVATVLGELGESLDSAKLAAVADASPVTWAQRLGYLLASTGHDDKIGPLRAFVQRKARQTAPLLAGAPAEGATRDAAWKLAVNADVEPDL